MEKNMKAFLGLIVIALFILVIFYVPTFFEQGTPQICFEDGVCQHEEIVERG